ncbi:MAG: ATP-binding protein [Bacteroidota bacterium]
MRISIPSKISSDYSGFNNLVNIHNLIKDIMFEKVTFDFANCNWFEANLSAVLGAVCNKLLENLNTVEFVNLKPATKIILEKNEFLKHFGGDIITDKYKTTIKYRRYQSTEQTLFKEYLDKELLSKEDMPKMSELLQKKINESIFEIFENAVTHGNSKNVFSCGQYYPKKNPPRIDFTIVDLGTTIKAKVNNFLNEDLSSTETIKWAVDARNTTKTGNTPGGLGLKIIRNFLSINKGEIQIVSANGFWQKNKNNRIFAKKLDNYFAGTIVNLEFNLDDRFTYITKEEVQKLKKEDIF